MVFVLVLCGLVIGVYLLLIALLLVAGFYGVFGAIVYGPFFVIRYIWRVFDGEDALEKSYDVRKSKKTKRVREPREVSNVRLTDRKPSKIKKVAEAKKPAVKVVQVLKPKKASNTVESGNPSKKSVSVRPSANKPKTKTKQGIPAVANKVETQKANPRNSASKKPNPRKVEPQGITPNIPTTSPLTDYPDMV